MFKNFKSLSLLALATSFLTISSCSTDEDNSINESNSTSYDTNFVTKSTNNSKKIIIELLDFGVKEIHDTGSVLTFSTYNDFYYRDQLVDFSNYTVTYDSTSLKTNNSELVVDSSGNSYLRRNGNLVNTRTIPIQNFVVEEFVLVMAHLQQSGNGGSSYTYQEYETNSNNGNNNNGGCPFWKVRRAAGVGFTQAEAEADLWYATRSFVDEHQGCTSIGGVSHKFVGVGDFGFEMAIQSFCCP
ncbi:hypothetical protein [Flavobacterium litorale]|uniref:SCP domain-containing protein n=1 Tax=Flavobacterium litorale TaxID=2856519 RepID=A0ABX8VCW7_9FLAO|nr:hypothetical protein [Flavobacterium litorale]QYJ68886.1 hypothetical protein K1I41_03100 [Flavobacterium litorale]